MATLVSRLYKETMSSGFGFAYFVLTVLLLLTIGVTIVFFQNAKSKDNSRFAGGVNSFQAEIDGRLEKYSALLNSCRGFVESAGELDRQKFSSYAEILNLNKNYSGVRRIGFIKNVKRTDAAALAAQLKSDGFADFRIFPEGDKDTYQTLLFSEPADEITARSIGFDFSSDNELGTILDTARDTGRGTASSKQIPTSDSPNGDQKQSIIVYLPIYRQGAETDTIDSRRANITGYVFTSIVPEAVLANFDSVPNTGIGIKLYDGAVEAETELASTPVTEFQNHADLSLGPLRSTSEFNVADRKWIAEYSTLAPFSSQSGVSLTPIVFLAGVCLSFLFFGMTHREACARGDLQRLAGELLESQKQREELLAAEQISRIQAEQANRAKDEFIALLSHELKTPLNAIAGWTRILTANDISDQTRDTALGKIDKNLRLQASIVEQLLSFSDIMSQSVELSGEKTFISDLFEAAIEDVLPSAAEKEIQIEKINLLDGQSVAGDREKLKLAIANVLANAIKFSETGGIIDAEVFESDNMAHMIVRDHGKGIEAEVLPHIFEQYKQADRPITRGYGGLGLGLTVADHIFKIHGGSVEAKSDGKAKGATFTVKLPIVR